MKKKSKVHLKRILLGFLTTTVLINPMFADSVKAKPVIGGVAKTIYDNMVLKNENNPDGKVAAATSSTPVYLSADVESDVVNVVVQNQIIRILDESNGFYKLKYGKGYAWVWKDDFVADDDLVQWIASNPDWYVKNVEVTSEETTMYDWISGEPLGTLQQGDMLQLREISDNYYVVIYTKVSQTGAETNTLVNVAKSDSKLCHKLHVTSFSNAVTRLSSAKMDLIEYACSFVGCPYVWGGSDPNTGADCSGFIQYVFAEFGYDLPRCSWQQAESGVKVEFSDLQPGDLVFYQRGERIGHVALYIGDGLVVQARGKNYNICITPYDYSIPAWAVRIID